MRAYLVDDEPLAVSRLRRLLEQTARVEVVGDCTDPETAVVEIGTARPDVLFLDIEMPGMSGFDLLERLGGSAPLVVFTTAFDRYALDAFKVSSLDYLLKPVEPAELNRALNKVEHMLHGGETRGNLQALARQIRAMMAEREPDYLVRVASRVGDRVEFIAVADVTHFYAKDKLTFASTAAKDHALDMSLAELERKLPPRRWVRIHRSTLLNVDAVKELHGWFGGKSLVKLKDGRTELQVSRERVAEVKSKLGL